MAAKDRSRHLHTPAELSDELPKTSTVPIPRFTRNSMRNRLKTKVLYAHVTQALSHLVTKLILFYTELFELCSHHRRGARGLST